MSAATYVYMAERLWAWEGPEVVAIAARPKVQLASRAAPGRAWR